MSFGEWLAREVLHVASQGVFLWSARAECPLCTCKPSLVCGGGREAVQLDCPAASGTWPLSAVLLALVCGLLAGAALARLLAPAAPARAPAGIEKLDEEAWAQAALVRARLQAQ